MTPPDRDALIARLRDGLNLLRARVDNNETHLWTCNGDDDGSPCDCGAIRRQDLVDQLLDALAALPPPATLSSFQEEARQKLRDVLARYDLLDEVHGLGRDVDEAVRWALGALADPTATDAATPPPADPPALVALVREWQQDIENLGSAGPDEDITDQYQKQVWESEARLLAYPLPAAPPVTDTPQGWQPIETAPKDGHAVIALTWNNERCVVYWNGSDWRYAGDGWCGGSAPRITRWHEMPAAPPQEDQ